MPEFIVLGSMSGTSKDGHDVAKLRIDVDVSGDLRHIEWIDSKTYPYTQEQRQLIIDAEQCAAALCDDAVSSEACVISSEADVISSEVERSLHAVSDDTLVEMTGSGEVEMTGKGEVEMTGKGEVERSLHIFEQALTEWHIQDFKSFLQEFPEPKPTLLGYHGQTVFHDPANRITIQLGDGGAIAKALGLSVVYDLRKKDVELGGQGAPLAGMLHHALVMSSRAELMSSRAESVSSRAELMPSQEKLMSSRAKSVSSREKSVSSRAKSRDLTAVVNIGGIANVSLIQSDALADVIAFDTGPGNTLINRYVSAKVGESMDENARYGLNGRVDDEAVAEYAYAVFKDSNYLGAPAPKSLDISDLQLLPELDQCSLEDACAFYESITAYILAKSLHAVIAPEKFVTVILAGGGSKNPMIVKQLSHYLNQFNLGANVLIADEIPGWENDALEAGLFAYLAVRRILNLPTSYPSMTGVPTPIVGGLLCPGK